MDDKKINRIEIVKASSGYIMRSWSADERMSLPKVLDIATSLPDLVEKIIEQFQWEDK